MAITHTIHGVPHDPDNPTAILNGLWTVRDYDQCQCTDPADLLPLLVRPASVYASSGRDISLTIPETAGNKLYWVEFSSSDASGPQLGPFLFTLTGDRTWDDIMANPAPTPSGGGGSSDFTGEGPPVVDPAVAGIGKTYIDTESGALYIVTGFDPGDGPIPEWALVGGEIKGVNAAEGIILGNGLVMVGKSVAGTQVLITDIDAYENSGNGVRWIGTGTDGDQNLVVQVGPVGEPVSALQAFADGGIEFGGEAYFDRATHADGPIGTRSNTEPADDDIRNRECFYWFDSTNGAAKVMFKAKTADGTVVEATIPML